MTPNIEVYCAMSALAASGVLLAAVKVRGSAGLLHYAAHGRLYAHPTLNRWVGEAVSIVSLSVGFDEYRRIHGLHHGFRTFAQPAADEEATGLLAQGFAPGRNKESLMRLFLVTPFNPLWHLRQASSRLNANFLRAPLLRRAAAWSFWGGLGLIAAASDWLPGFFGATGLLLTSGSIGSYLELVSRHIWNITPTSTGRARQLELSRWRLPAPALPDRWTVCGSLRFAGSVAMKALWRFVVVPVDLAHHAAHHLAWDTGSQVGDAPPPWTDAALAYSDRLRADANLRAYVCGSLDEVLDASFEALEAAPPLTHD